MVPVPLASPGARAASFTPREWESELLVTDRRTVADEVVLIELMDPDGGPLPAWDPGAHLDLLLPNGLVRQYSLTGDHTRRDRWQVGVLREPDGRGGSEWVHDRLHVGAAVRVRGPRNHFALEPAARYHFVAGGIGITPIAAMAHAATGAGATWELTYCGRSRSTMALIDELCALGGDRVHVHPADEDGRVDLQDLITGLAPDVAVYCCGPPGLIEGLEQACARAGRPAPRVERFTPKEIDRSRDSAFEIELAQSGRVLQVPAKCSILDVLRSAGVETLASCEEGTCGTCETGVLEGVPEHRDSVLTAEEQAANDFMLVCVSRACSKRLVLDL